MAPTRRSDADVIFGDHIGVVATDDTDAVAGPDDESAADTEEDEMPAVPARRRSDADVLFGDAVARDLDLSANLEKLGDRLGWTVQQQKKEREEFGTVAHELGLDNRDAERLHDLTTQHRLRKGTPEWDQQVQRWPEASRRQLREQLGATEAERMRSEMQSFIDARPALAKTLGEDLRDHPRVTELLTPIVRRGSARRTPTAAAGTGG